MKRVIVSLFLFFTIGFTLLSSTVHAQQSRESFGKNRKQYKDFEWKYYYTDNFDIYYYKDGDQNAKEVALFLESEFDRITDVLGYHPYSKTKIFLYNSISDLQQSNVGVGDAQFSIGGETKISKSHIEVANPGTMWQLKRELLLKVSELFVDDMLYGGSLKEMFQSTYLMNLPQWFVLGVSEYVAKGWNEDMDDYIREMINSKRVTKISRFAGEDAKTIGHSFWNYIAEKYGQNNISNILNYTRIMRNEEKSISVTLGVNFKYIVEGWYSFYSDQAAIVNKVYADQEELQMVHKNKRRFYFHNVKISPEGNKIAYTKNNQGRYDVVIMDLETQKEEEVIIGGNKVINQRIDEEVPLISWVDQQTLAVITIKKGIPVFWLYDFESKSKTPRPMDRFSNIKSMSFSDNGKLAIISAEINGKNDLYLMSTRRDRFRRITNDVYDDLFPSFIPGTNAIVFTSNRPSDTLKTKKKPHFSDADKYYNLYVYDLDTTKNVLAKITNTVSNDFRPLALSSEEIFYLSDQKGITNVFKYSLKDKTYSQVTNFRMSIRDYDISFDHKKLVLVSLKGSKERIYLDDNFDFNQSRFTVQSPRMQVKQAKFLIERKKSLADIVKNNRAIKKEPKDTTKINSDPNFIDTDNFEFSPQVKEETSSKPLISLFTKKTKQTELEGPFPYETKFSTNNIVTSFEVDPIRGFGLRFETQMNDLLENHRFYGGIMANLDFKNGDIYAEYQYLGDILDYSFRFERSVYKIEKNIEGSSPAQSNVLKEKYASNKFEVGISYPLTVKTKIEIRPFYMQARFDDQTAYVNIAPPGPGFKDAQLSRYGGAHLNLVYDNAIVKELNHIEGSRAKLSVTQQQGISSNALSFSRITLDVRRYQKIHREIILAGRLFYGNSAGANPQKFLLGGMDNWLFQDLNTDGVENPLNIQPEVNNQEILFTEFVTSLRGYNLAQVYGKQTVLLNAELRMPLVRYLHSGPISSNFFRNLMFVGFYDIGTAWNDDSPFNEDNNINVTRSRVGNFDYTVNTYESPWLQSYGLGFRTIILGYYMKTDVAWPLVNGKPSTPVLHVSLGFDF